MSMARSERLKDGPIVSGRHGLADVAARAPLDAFAILPSAPDRRIGRS